MRKDMTLEQALDRLDAVVAQLGDGGLPLDKALKLFEEGTALVRLADEKMKDAQLKVETLTKELHPEEEQEDADEL